jgi:hypothetical protein
MRCMVNRLPAARPVGSRGCVAAVDFPFHFAYLEQLARGGHGRFALPLVEEMTRILEKLPLQLKVCPPPARSLCWCVVGTDS